MAISNPASAVFVIHIGCILLSKASCLDEFFFGYILCELHCSFVVSCVGVQSKQTLTSFFFTVSTPAGPTLIMDNYRQDQQKFQSCFLFAFLGRRSSEAMKTVTQNFSF